MLFVDKIQNSEKKWDLNGNWDLNGVCQKNSNRQKSGT